MPFCWREVVNRGWSLGPLLSRGTPGSSRGSPESRSEHKRRSRATAKKNGNEHYRAAYRDAEAGTDEGPICNLGLITQYLSCFMEEYSPILTGRVLSGGTFANLFFSSYLYARFRLGESEYEDAED